MHGTGAASSYGDLLVTSLVVLGGVCIAAFVAVRVLGRFLATGRVRGAHLLDVVARVPLEPRRSLYVVEVAGKTLLVGTSEMGLSVLSELDGNEVRARTVPRPSSFAELVRSAWARRRGKATVADRDAPSASETPSGPSPAQSRASDALGSSEARSGASDAPGRSATATGTNEAQSGVSEVSGPSEARSGASDAPAPSATTREALSKSTSKP